jgi:hypothetical protein
MDRAINAQSIMGGFAASTGLSDTSREPRRYLWTDAFAVCNYLELYRQTGEQSYLQLALKLVDQVHQVLGRHREDSVHSGWLSGLTGEQARQHPTLGGLRIGKQLNERPPGEASNDSMEWDQDGQYFHYLTKWMHALNCVSRDMGKGIYNQWAVELARVAHTAFTYTPPAGGTKRMYWKMSIDLSRPLVDSMGQHDPLDGLITYRQLEFTANRFPDTPPGLSLRTETEDMVAMCAGHSWATQDPLGIGGLLSDAYRLVQLIDTHHLPETTRLEALLRDIEHSLQVFITQNQLSLPVEYRLAFRELGLSIGLHALNRMQKRIEQSPAHFTDASQLTTLLTNLSRFHHIHELIESFWLEPEHQSAKTWKEHTDINSVMLATSLAPDGYLHCV